MKSERKVPVMINGQIHHYITPHNKKVSFWSKHQQTVCGWLTLCALIVVIEMMFIHAM